MKINEKLHGFTVQRKIRIDELDCDLYVLIYEKNGARLVFLDREDENKTFSIAFRTPPEDSTGVFHILEHSVLCGSGKFPLKDPFVELLKGSLNTFLNAMTFQDKTMYPVSSRNDKDFLNLVDVYMDAVLHPLAVKSPNAFYQEGWHYEINDNDELSYKGVVLNEMRGDYSSAESVADRHINEMLYPNTCYREDSGGDPDCITTLTYEQFVEVHKKYYHPSNSEIFLDGSVDLNNVLLLLDSYLSSYEKREIPTEGISYEKINPPVSRIVEYEISSEETTENKTRVCLGYIVSRFDEQKKLLASSVLFNTLFSNNESPAKKVIIDSGVCEDVTVSLHDGILEPSVTVEFINIKDGREKEAKDLFIKVIKDTVERGIDMSQIYASLNAMEFKLRERDYGTLPLGVVFAMVSLESLLYSDDPAQNLRFDESIQFLRTAPQSFYEQLLVELFITNERIATLTMIPSSTLGKRRDDKEKEHLKKLARGMTSEQKSDIKRMCEELLLWQESEDSEEALATIPRLSASDIPTEIKKMPTEICELSGTTTILYDISTSGIVYTELYFDVSDIDAKELPYLFIFNSLLTNLPTSSHTALEIQSLIKAELGSFDVRATALTKENEPKVYISVSASALDFKKEKIIDITQEILCQTLFEDECAIRNFIRQAVIANEESFAVSGHQVALGRASAAVSVEAAAREYYSGYESHLVLKALDRQFDEKIDDIKEHLKSIQKRFFTRDRMLVSIVGCTDKNFAQNLAKIFESGEKVVPVCNISTIPKRREGILIPAQVAFCAVAYNIKDINEEPTGSLDVVRSLAGYEYLWGAVRVRGGAYGVGMIAGASGVLGFYSYRDPTPKRTLFCFGEVADFLRTFADQKGEISKYIIGAIGDSEPIRTPRMRGALATVRYLRGIDDDRRQKNRTSILTTDHDEVRRIGDIVEKCVTDAAVCVVSGKERLDALKNELDEILSI